MQDQIKVSTAKTLKRLANLGKDFADWYDTAHASIADWANARDFDVGKVIDVLAILSPRVQVSRNVSLTKEYFTNTEGLVSGVLPNVAAALSYWEETGDIRGPKTNQFAAALRGYANALVLDVWMARALQVEPAKVYNKAVLAKAQPRIENVANAYGWTIPQTQAAIWAGTIRENGWSPQRLQFS